MYFNKIEKIPLYNIVSKPDEYNSSKGLRPSTFINPL